LNDPTPEQGGGPADDSYFPWGKQKATNTRNRETLFGPRERQGGRRVLRQRCLGQVLAYRNFRASAAARLKLPGP
jgi:hypothetical protein